MGDKMNRFADALEADSILNAAVITRLYPNILPDQLRLIEDPDTNPHVMAVFNTLAKRLDHDRETITADGMDEDKAYIERAVTAFRAACENADIKLDE